MNCWVKTMSTLMSRTLLVIPPTCATIINQFVASEDDLILANATASLQAASAGTADIPILGTCVTDYATALEIDDWSGTTGKNISGTSDLAPLK